VVHTANITKRDLVNLFFDTVHKDRTLAAIVVTYTDGDERRTEIGAPCAIQDDILEITPYLRTNHSTVPEDYKNRNKKIPLKQIVRYARVDIAHLI